VGRARRERISSAHLGAAASGGKRRQAEEEEEGADVRAERVTRVESLSIDSEKYGMAMRLSMRVKTRDVRSRRRSLSRRTARVTRRTEARLATVESPASRPSSTRTRSM
jgi:hypothetical protein